MHITFDSAFDGGAWPDPGHSTGASAGEARGFARVKPGAASNELHRSRTIAFAVAHRILLAQKAQLIEIRVKI